jgi:hypothetical protein
MLEKLRHAAAEQAKHAGEVAQRAAIEATDRAGEAAARGLDRAVEVAKDPATHAKAKLAARGAAEATAKGAAKGAVGAAKGAGTAGRAVKSALDKVNPDLLASVVVKATSLQEQANATLRKNGSLYRISGIAIGAAFPPSVTFQIGRLSDLDREFIENPDFAPESGAPDAS